MSGFAKSSEGKVEHPRQYNHSLSTRRICFFGLATTWLLGAAAVIVVATIPTSPSENTTTYGSFSLNVKAGYFTLLLPLILAIVVTFCNECMGFIHSTTLRWALWREGRLKFNTNLRLLTYSNHSAPNAWFTNIICIFMAAISYTAASNVILVRIRRGDERTPRVEFSLPAMAVLSLGLLSQAAIATWAAIAMKTDILTWSSNGLNATLVCQQNGLQRLSGHSLWSYRRHGPNPTSSPQKPQHKQSSMGSSRPFAIWIVIMQWTIILPAFLWAGMASLFGVWDSAGFSGLHKGKLFEIYLNTCCLREEPDYAAVLLSITISLAAQLAFTFVLHCTELLVSVNRDEMTWRRAVFENGKGANLDSSAIRDAFTSWETITLFILKTAIHWAYGEAVQSRVTDGSGEITMWANCLFILAGLTVVVALFGTLLCFKRPSGPQPTAYGHFQTQVDLIDDFGLNAPLFWGDKGHIRWENDGTEVRTAGTSTGIQRVGPIQFDAVYT